MIVAVTFGPDADEKFAVKALLRHHSERAKVVVIVPEGIQDERGLSVLNDFVKRYVNEEGVELMKVPIGDFHGSVLTLARTFRSWAERPIVLNLSGGMRLLVVEALCAALISRVPMTIEVESEDGKALDHLPPHPESYHIQRSQTPMGEQTLNSSNNPLV